MPVRLTAEGERDPLFAGLASPLLVQQTHEDHVAALPAGATLLAGNELSPVQAFAWGESSAACSSTPSSTRSARGCSPRSAGSATIREAPGGAAAVRASIRETPDATGLLGRWLAHCVGG